MYDELNRFFIDADQRKIADNLFGSDRWRKAISLPSKEREEFLQSLYKEQLEKLVKYILSFKTVNAQNRTDYFLFFATSNLLGLEKMKDAMWKVDSTGTFTFLDLTDLNTPYLIKPEPDFKELKRRIVGQFKGKIITVEELKEFVLSKTPYRVSHYKRQVLSPMEKSGELEVPSPKLGRRKGAFPNGTLIKFN